jgi:hypothetical protein
MNALVLLTLCTSLITGQVDASAGLEHAKTFARIGDWENGIKFLEPYILNNPTDAEARLLLAECYLHWPDNQTVGEEVVDKNQARGAAQIGILAKLGDDGLKMLLVGLRSDTYDVYRRCFMYVGWTKDRRATDALIDIAKDGRRVGKARKAVNALVDIERDREHVDERVVGLLTSILREPEGDFGILREAAAGSATLQIREAAPLLTKALDRVAEALPAAPDIDRRTSDEAAIALTHSLIDAIAVLSHADLEKHVTGVLGTMNRQQMAALFKRARDRPAHHTTRVFLAKIGLNRVKADPDVWLTVGSIGRFATGMASRSPEVLLETEVKELLHELCESPRPEVRRDIYELIGMLRDEDALPILLAKLWEATLMRSLPTPSRVPSRPTIMARRARRPGVPVPPSFLRDDPESHEIWLAVNAIASPSTESFLLEKLTSDDMASVFAAARLLKELGARAAIQPLKKKYSELAGPDPGEYEQAVVAAIADAHKALSGQPIAEPPAGAAAGRRGMMMRGAGGRGRGGMNSRGRGGGSTGTMRGRMRGGGGRTFGAVTPVYKDGRVQGVQVKNVEQDEYARTLGLKEGDVLLTINGVKIRSLDELSAVMDKFQNARTMRIEVLRNGIPTTLTTRIQ